MLQSGQNLVTFGSVQDRPFVPGVPIGQVAQVQGNAGSLTQTALVKPFVDFTSLGVVGVVIAVPAQNPRDSGAAAGPKPVPTVTVTVTPGATGATHSVPATPTGAGPGLRCARLLLSVGARRGRRSPPSSPSSTGSPCPGAAARTSCCSRWSRWRSPAARCRAADRLPGRAGAGRRPAREPHRSAQYALVFCVVGYVCGRLADLGGESPALYVAISAGAAAVGAVLHAALGVMLSDPEVTWAAVRHVLPPSLDLRRDPEPVRAVRGGPARRLGGRRAGQERPVAPRCPRPRRDALGLTGLATGAVRQASASGSPRLHLGDRRGSSDAWIGPPVALARPGRRPGLGGSALSSKGVGGREPRLRFTGLGGGSGLGGSVGAGGARYTPPKAAPRMNFGRRGLFGGRGRSRAAVASAQPRSGVTPRFRKRTVTGTIGTGGALSRATPRRGTFGRSRSFGQRGSAGAAASAAGVV